MKTARWIFLTMLVRALFVAPALAEEDAVVPAAEAAAPAPDAPVPAADLEAPPVEAPAVEYPAPDPAPAEEEDSPAAAEAPLPPPQPRSFPKKQGPAPIDFRELAGGGPVVALSLADVIRDVVFYNPAVEKARLEWLAGLHRAKGAWGYYEPALAASFRRDDLDRENSQRQIFQDGAGFLRTFFERVDQHKLGVEGRVFSGATYNLGYTMTETNSPLSRFNEYQSFAGVTMKQPLLKGAWFGAPTAEVKAGKVERGSVFHGFRSRLMNILYETESAYWGLCFAEEKYRAAGDSVQIARKLVTDSEERLRTGKMSRLDLVEAEAGLAVRLGDRADARRELMDAMNRLKLILSSDRVPKDAWIRSATPLRDSGAGAVDAGEDAEAALRVQPDYLVRRAELEMEKLRLDVQRDRALPEVNATGSYGYSGYANSRNNSLEKLKKKNHRAWSTGLEVNVPLLLGVQGRHAVAAARLKKSAAEESLKAAEYEITSSLRVLRERVKALHERIREAGSVVDFRERLLDVEFSRLRAGKSNTRLIFDAEEKLAESRRAELESLVRYREALVQRALVSGDLLAEKGLEKDADGPVLEESLLQPRR